MNPEKKDPLLLADDDHPERKDISEVEFKESLLKIQNKYGKKKSNSGKTEFSSGVIDALNSTQQ